MAEAEAALNSTLGSAIINGRTTLPGEWEGTIMVVGNNGQCSGGLCTGSFIHPRVVLSAGHCCAANARKAICGGKNRPGRLLAVSTTLRTLRAGGNDFCIIRLDRAVNDVPIYEVATSVAPADGIIVGYGVVNSGSPQRGAGTQRDGMIRVSSVSGVDIRVTGRSGQQYQNACNGDSGGPLFIRKANGQWVQAGVTSRGPQLCPPGATAIYTSAVANANVNLIRSATQEWGTPVTPGTCPVAQCCYDMRCNGDDEGTFKQLAELEERLNGVTNETKPVVDEVTIMPVPEEVADEVSALPIKEEDGEVSTQPVEVVALPIVEEGDDTDIIPPKIDFQER